MSGGTEPIHEPVFKFERLGRNISLISLGALSRDMSLEETVDYLAEELDLQRSEHVRETGESVAELRD